MVIRLLSVAQLHYRSQVPPDHAEISKGRRFGPDWEFCRKIAIAPHEMTALEASVANFENPGCNLHIAPVIHKYDGMEVQLASSAECGLIRSLFNKGAS